MGAAWPEVKVNSEQSVADFDGRIREGNADLARAVGDTEYCK